MLLLQIWQQALEGTKPWSEELPIFFTFVLPSREAADSEVGAAPARDKAEPLVSLDLLAAVEESIGEEHPEAETAKTLAGFFSPVKASEAAGILTSAAPSPALKESASPPTLEGTKPWSDLWAAFVPRVAAGPTEGAAPAS